MAEPAASNMGDDDQLTSDDPVVVLLVGTSHLAQSVAQLLAGYDVELVRPGSVGSGDRIDVAMFCDDDDVGNIAAALELREYAPSVRIVLRSFNSRVRERLPELLGDCRVLSASRTAAPELCNLAVGEGGPESGPARRSWIVRGLDRMRGSHASAVARQLLRRPLFRWMVGIMLALIVLQAWIAHEAFGYDALRSIHAGVAAIVTLGFADEGLIGPTLADEPAWVQVGSVFSMLIDVVLITVLLGLVADALVSERFARVFGGSARRMRGHVVVAGLGTVGYRVVRELTRRGYRVAAIEADEDGAFVNGARGVGAHVTIADVRQEEEFAALAVDRAVAFLALTDDDAANLEAAFTSMAIAPEVPVVVRCFDSALAERLEAIDGIAASRSVGRLAAPHFVAAALES
ncbi:MAG: NAD-binding protein [Thermoleophilia bacterium]|nr:NAD-binding protein [Thermoleophilia bacterium]